jgi:hypothetical protein
VSTTARATPALAENQASVGVPSPAASILHLRQERARVGDAGSELRAERLLRQSEGASLGVLADCPCFAGVDHAPTERLDSLQGVGDVAHRKVGQGEGIPGAAPASMNADRGESRMRLPALSLAILASLKLDAEELRPEAPGARGIVSGKFNE